MSATLLLLLQVAGPDIHVLAGVDFFGVNQPSSSDFADAEIGYGLRFDLRHLPHNLDVRVDYRDREALTGNDSRHELHTLALTYHCTSVDATVGRFAVAGDFWLITDGARLAARLRPDVTIEAYGGLRAYTTGRVEADLRSDPFTLPLAGAGILIDRPTLHASLFGTYAQDELDFERGTPGSTPTEGSVVHIDRSYVDGVFIDGQLVWLPRPDLFVAGGFTLGSRYPVLFSSVPGMFAAPPTVDTDILGSVMTYALVDWTPTKDVHVGYAFDFDRVQIIVPQLPLDNTMVAAGGSFEDHTLKGSVRVWRSLLLEARYRLRFRESTDVIHRVEAGARGDNLVGAFGAFATVGADVWDERPALASRDVYTVTGGVTFARPWFDARAGLLYTDAIGSGVAFSTHAQQAMGAGPTSELFPFVLEAQRIAFVRAFGLAHFFADGELFFGFDSELNLDVNQTRLMFQLGYAR